MHCRTRLQEQTLQARTLSHGICATRNVGTLGSERRLPFVIAYRELLAPKSEAVCIVGSERQVRETLERLGREGCEVTHITPSLNK